MRTTLALALTVLTITGCGADAPGALPFTAAGPLAAGVDIDRSRYSDTELVIPAGTTVTFRNNDAVAHTVTTRDGAPAAIDSGDLQPSETFAVSFGQPGEYRYFCRIHPTMRATVVVT